MMKRIGICIFVLITITPAAQGQNTVEPLQVGDVMPDVSLKVEQYPSNEIKLSDFEDKLVILDFWNTYCGTCIAGFPKLDSLQKVFEDELQVILVNRQTSDEIAEVFRKREQDPKDVLPDVPSVSGDTLLSSLFPHPTVPHHVWIKGGKVFAITNHQYATVKNVRAVLVSDTVRFHPKSGKEISFEIDKPLVYKGNGGKDLKPLYQSVITGRIAGQGAGYSPGGNSLMVYNSSIPDLYIDAFDVPRFPYQSRLVLEVCDSLKTLLINNEQGDDVTSLNAYHEWLDNNTYCYNLVIDEGYTATADDVPNDVKHSIMQQDLNRFFGISHGIVGKIEKRRVKCLALTGSPDMEKINNLDLVDKNRDKSRDFILEDRSLEIFVRILSYRHHNYPLPIVDATGFEEAVSLAIKNGIGDLENVKNQLKEYGLELREEMRLIDVLVISEVGKQIEREQP